MFSSIRIITGAATSVGMMLALSVASPATAGTIKLVDYNTSHGGTAKAVRRS